VKTRILSDLHLGHVASKVSAAQLLEPLLEGCDRLILAGDIWQERTQGESFEKAKGLLDDLMQMVDQRGIQLELLRGNHDPGSEKGIAWLLDRKVLVTHGDAVFDDATPWSREIATYRDEVDAIVERYRKKSHLAEACSERAREIALRIKSKPLPRLPVPLNFFCDSAMAPLPVF